MIISKNSQLGLMLDESEIKIQVLECEKHRLAHESEIAEKNIETLKRRQAGEEGLEYIMEVENDSGYFWE